MSLAELRQKIDGIDENILQLLLERAALLRDVAREKHAQGIPTHAAAREAQMFVHLHKRAQELGLDPDYILELWSVIIVHTKEIECDLLGLDTPFSGVTPPADELRQNLLRLTELVAPVYHEYRTGHASQAIQWYLSREYDVLTATIRSLPEQELAFDLGCATGQTTEILEPYFHWIAAYDISPHMIEIARSRRSWKSNVHFATQDVNDILVNGGELSFAVASFGTASEFPPEPFLSNLADSLQPGGKAVLSFYNKNALSLSWFRPWPSTLHAHLNPLNNTLEVWHDGEAFIIPGWGMTAARLQELASARGLRVAMIESSPTLLSILPHFFFRSPRFQGAVGRAQSIDDMLARAGPSYGTYLLAVLEKPIAPPAGAVKEHEDTRPGGWGEGYVRKVTPRGFGC